MARDEFWLENAPEPMLRLYSWECVTVSLGYSQRWSVEGFPLVRRPTGGRALLHTPEELTYAIVLPDAGDSRVDESFCFLTGTLREALNSLGVPVTCSRRGRAGGRSESCLACVQRGELVLPAGKLVGSAQARRGRRLLQQGTIPFNPSQALHDAVFGPHPPVVAAGVRFTAEELAEAWRQSLGVTWRE